MDTTASAIPNSTATVTQFGSTLDYRLHFNYTPDPTTPDGFSASIFDVTTGQPLATDGSPDGTSFYTIDFLTPSPVVNTYGSSANGLAAPTVDPIPEPSTWAMFGFGKLMLAWWQRRRRSSQVPAI